MNLFGGNRSAFTSAIMLMVAAFLLKALIPAGFMPGAEGGMAKLVICSGLGEKTIYVPADGQPSSDHKKSSGEHCAYQVLASLKNFVTPPQILLPLPQNVFIANETATQQVITSRIDTPFTARGPPLSV